MNTVYELAKLIGIDVSNLNKVIQFFEEIGGQNRYLCEALRAGRDTRHVLIAPLAGS